MQQQIYQMLVSDDEVTWQSVLQDLIKRENLDPWDIDVSTLTQQYILEVKKLKEHNFRVSGKVILAAAILLKMKSSKFVGEDMLELDRLINSTEEDMSEEEFYDELANEFHTPGQVSEEERHKLIPRTPRGRKRKVTVYDLMEALEQALEVRRRKVIREMPDMRLAKPEKTVDITVRIKHIFGRIKNLFGKYGFLSFTQLVPSDSKEDKIQTFIPLLHLCNMRKVDLTQKEPFGEIGIELLPRNRKEQVDKELGVA